VKPGHGHETECLSVQIGEDEMYTTLEVLPDDATLIAAAPDLLTHLKRMIWLVEVELEADGQHILEGAKQAVKKATN
jgi:hypothetical protein